MEISGIRSSMPFMFPGKESAVAAQKENAMDTVDIRGGRLLDDAEADSVLRETIGMIGVNRADALSVHSGLSESRVFALLGI